MEAATAPLALFLADSDATESEELPASEAVVSESELSECEVSAVFAWEAETDPLLPEPESLGSGVVERDVLEGGMFEPPAAEEPREFAGDGTTGESSKGDETRNASSAGGSSHGDSAAELATAGEDAAEHDTLGLVSSTMDCAAGLEAWDRDDTGGGDDTLTSEEASDSHMIGATALRLEPKTMRTMNAMLVN